MRFVRAAAAAAVLLAYLSACGVPGDSVVSDDERQLGAEQHPLLLAEFGGAYDASEAAYVEQIGARMAQAAGLDGQCTFTLVNTDVVNAFAVPGCYIYVTRGLMALVSSEDELASVLAHELGHIAGEHAERQQRRSALRSFGVAAISAVTRSERLTRLAGSAAAYFTLRYSRKNEYEADTLGLRYLQAARYDPYAASDMLASLDRHQDYLTGSNDRDGAKSIPEWALTHPYTDNRVVRARAEASASGIREEERAERVAEYLGQLDGLLYGDDPEQGFVLGRAFAHPVMRIAFVAPPGFTLTNSPQAVMIDGPDGLRGEFSGGQVPAGGLRAYAQAVLGGLLGDVPAARVSGQDLRINGLPAHVLQASVETQQGLVIVSLAAYATAQGSAYHFAMVSSPQSAPQQAIADLFRSFRMISPAEAANLRPRVIDVVRARAGDTLRSLAARMQSERALELVSALNGREPDDPLRPGELIKLVVWR